MAIQWHADLSLGHPEIDDDHRHLVRLVGEFERCPDLAQAEAVARRLYRRMHDHFAREELLQVEFGYPRRAEHQREHRRILDEMKAIVVAAFIRRETAEIGAVIRQVSVLMQDWVARHIADFDREMAAHLWDVDPTFQVAPHPRHSAH